MNWFNTIAVMAVAYLAVFFQATFNETRAILGVQIDLLPSLMVYASLSGNIMTVSLLAVLGGLWFDSLSANPMGTSVLPLFLVGFLFQRSREFILREQPFAQWVLGACAGVAIPLLSVLLLLNTNAQPLLSWFSLWQWIVLIAVSGVTTPVWFFCFEWLGTVLNYTAVGETSFRSDRQIKRGR